MKEYLKHLARGNFTYDIPKLNINQELIIKAPCDSVQKASFNLCANAHTVGIVWSQNDRVVIRNNVFSGTQCKIDYEIHTKGFVPGDSIKGTFDIISISGEKQIPYEIQVIDKIYEASIGSINNVFQFYNLAHQSLDEAVKFFDNDNFKHIVLKDDILLNNVYDLLKIDNDRYRAMFEFLVAAHKKNPVTIHIARHDYKYNNAHVDILGDERAVVTIMDCSDNSPYKLLLNKSGWGYVKIDVKTDNPFIVSERVEIYNHDFTANQCALSFVIDVNQLHAGINFGRITLCTYNQELCIEIIVRQKMQGAQTQSAQTQYAQTQNAYTKAARQYSERELLIKAVKLYIDYRLEHMDTESWISQYAQIVKQLQEISPASLYYKLMEAQVLSYQGRMAEAKYLVDEAGSKIYNQDVRLFCYYNYICTTIKKDDVYTIKMASVVRDYYENGLDDWRVLWMLFYMDKNYSRNASMKLVRIKEAFKKGCHSPIMYFEALAVMNNDPMLLRVLNSFELHVIAFGLRHKKITQRLAEYINFLIRNEKVANIQMINIVKQLYGLLKQDSMLETLVIHLIRNEMCTLDCFPYYEKAVLRGLKITRLYEFYVKSMDRSTYHKLPQVVLMYFQYEVHLNYVDQAYLYANILTNEIHNHEIFSAYEEDIKNFGYEQLCMDRLDQNLLLIYKYIWSIDLLDQNTAESMVNLMFTYKVQCFDRNVQHVLVKHKELTLFDRYPLVNGFAYVAMFTKDCTLAFECLDGSIHKDTLNYTIEKVFDNTELLQEALDNLYRNEYTEFYKFETGHSGNMADTVQYLAGLKGIEEQVKAELHSWLIDYYYNQRKEMANKNSTAINRIEIERFISINHLGQRDAKKYIDICSDVGMLDTACDLIKSYGIEGVSCEVLCRIGSFLLEKLGNAHDVLLLDICFKSFSGGAFNERILSYLSDNFNGTSEEMYQVWNACAQFNIDRTDLSERILAQMLFCSQQGEIMTEVFKDYYSNGGKRTIIDAYIGYHSFLYFVRQRTIDDAVFDVIAHYLSENYKVQDICKLAYLKKMSQVPEKMTDAQKLCTEKLLYEMCEENKCYDFYKSFGNTLCLPYMILDQTYVQYIGNPDAKVKIYFYRNGQETQLEDEIITGCCGVYAKGFTLFYGDSISYYFTEESGGVIKRSETCHIVCDRVLHYKSTSKFDDMNDMLASKKNHDIAALKKQMNVYCEKDYVVNHMFQIL